MALGISRPTLPQEFSDSISSKLLAAPEPQYLHALLIKGALEANMDRSAMNMLIGLRGGMANGPDPYAPIDRGRLTLADPIMSDAFMVFDELAEAGIGHTVRVNRPKFLNSTYGLNARRVPVGSTISTTSIAVASDQVPITLERFAGPYDGSQSAVAPYALERFDAMKAKHNLEDVVGLHLQRDFDRWLDSVGVSLFDAASTITNIRPIGMTTDDTTVVAGDFPMDFATLASAETALVGASVPTFANGKYVAVLHQGQCEQLSRDPEYERQSVFEPPMNPLYTGAYLKTVGNFMVYRSTTLTVVNSTTNNIPVRYGQAFGKGMVGGGMAPIRPGTMGPQIVPSTIDNYGETSLWIWLAYMGFSTLDDRFGVSIHTT